MTATTLNEPFAKLFDTPHGQLLAYLDEDDEGQPAITVIGADYRGVRPSAKLSGYSDATQAQVFNEFDQSSADKMAANLHLAAAKLTGAA